MVKTIIIAALYFHDHFSVYVSGTFDFTMYKMPRDTNTEMVTKIVPVRAVNMPIGAFCTEFRRGRFCDDDVFGNWGRQVVSVT